MGQICSTCNMLKPLSDFNGKNPTQCKSCRYAVIKKWKKANYQRVLRTNREWRHANPEKRLIHERRWREKNKESHYAKIKAWHKANPEKRRAAAKKSSYNVCARKRCAMPKWANKFFMEEAYSLARLRSSMLGKRWVVDHIVPLISDKVCGLHAHTNIRVIPHNINSSKGNRWWPNMAEGQYDN